MSRSKVVGLLPAAGRAGRLHPFRYPKELLPVLYEPDATGRRIRPVFAIEHSLQAMRLAEITRVLVVVSPSKVELIRVLGNGLDFGVQLAYVSQETPSGLARAVDAACGWLGDDFVSLALPDTIIRPADALSVLSREFFAQKADLALAVFPTDRPHELGPVRIGPEGNVIEVQDKPAHALAHNTWALAVWSPTFTVFAHKRIESALPTEDMPLGTIFDDAVKAGMKVVAVFFPHGRFHDIGTHEGIATAMRGQDGVRIHG